MDRAKLLVFVLSAGLVGLAAIEQLGTLGESISTAAGAIFVIRVASFQRDIVWTLSDLKNRFGR